MVGLSVEDEVAGKSCRRQEVLTVKITSNNDMVTDGLSELTRQQNPNPKNYDLFYGSDTIHVKRKEIL